MAPGPIPNRSNDLSRRRKSKGVDVANNGAPITKIETSREVTIPEANPEWCEPALLVWKSGLESDASRYFLSTDYAYLFVLCDQLHYSYAQGNRRSADLLRVIFAGLGDLLFSEGSRRRLRVEVERAAQAPAWESSANALIAQFAPRRDAAK